MAAAALALAASASSAGTAYADPPAPPPPPAPKTTIENDGTYSVGTDIVPGTYTSGGPADAGACYWKRQGGPMGIDIIDNAMTKKPQVVQIELSDTAFKTTGCQPWVMTNATVPPPMPTWLAPWQLRAYIDTVNAGARQVGAGQLPRP